jgi:hypothetical protein
VKGELKESDAEGAMVPEEAIEAVDALPFMIRLSVFGRFTINTSI